MLCLRRALSTRIRRIASAAAAKKWPRLSQCLTVLGVNQPEIGLMHQGRRLQSLAGLLVGEFGGSEFTKFVVDQWQEPLGGGRITVLDLG